jgi:hypothetical protein
LVPSRITQSGDGPSVAEIVHAILVRASFATTLHFRWRSFSIEIASPTKIDSVDAITIAAQSRPIKRYREVAASFKNIRPREKPRRASFQDSGAQHLCNGGRANRYMRKQMEV